MDFRDFPAADRNVIRRCDCGCDTFRFKHQVIEDGDFQHARCRNCGHMFIEHTVYVRKQAE